MERQYRRLVGAELNREYPYGIVEKEVADSFHILRERSGLDYQIHCFDNRMLYVNYWRNLWLKGVFTWIYYWLNPEKRWAYQFFLPDAQASHTHDVWEVFGVEIKMPGHNEAFTRFIHLKPIIIDEIKDRIFDLNSKQEVTQP